MDKISVKACAKLNLFLDITGKLPNGYHQISSVMQSIDIFDYVSIKKADNISVKCSRTELNGEDNIAHKAAKFFFEKVKINGGAEIFIDKRIPMEAGMAGGSADAAAVIYGLNELYETNFSEKELCDIAVLCGADVPFSLCGGTKLSEGIGEKLTELPNIPDCWIVVIKPDFGMSTKESYRLYDEHGANSVEHGNLENMKSALENSDIHSLAKALNNVLEITFPNDMLGEIKADFAKFGAVGSLMTGSGTAVYGIFDDLKNAVNAKNVLSEKYSGVFITRPTNYGVAFNKSAKVYERLDSLGISYERIDHPAVYTMEEMNELGIFGKGTVGKNLFLRDAKGKRHFLIFVYGDKHVSLAEIQEKCNITRCSFGSAERLDKYLGLTKGSVSPLGVVNDENASVEFIIDRDFINCPLVGVHPNQNTSTLWLSFDDLEKFIKANGNSVRFTDI